MVGTGNYVSRGPTRPACHPHIAYLHREWTDLHFNMADDRSASPVPPSPGGDSIPEDEIFLNGDSQNEKKNNLLHPGDNYCGPENPIPRRSSLVKDGSRRTNRKKTVSFSSMPAEKKIVNGESRISST